MTFPSPWVVWWSSHTYRVETLGVRQKGSYAICQDEAIKLGAAEEVPPLSAIPKAMLDAVQHQKVSSK